MNPFNWSYRTINLFGAAFCFSSISYALYVQYHMLMMPCPLCIFQRVAIICVGVFFLIAALHNPKSIKLKWLYALLAATSALIGALIAGRHVAIQLMPADQAPLCNSLGLDYMLDAMPLTEVIATVFKGSGECAKIDWTFLGLSMPMWTFGMFIFLIVLAVLPLLKKSNIS
ncbi:MAG: disulfide bond formation protein B [Agitococcus sp.]|nr:disulfide bond formation protein B [Agitococcus sp.]